MVDSMKFFCHAWKLNIYHSGFLQNIHHLDVWLAILDNVTEVSHCTGPWAYIPRYSKYVIVLQSVQYYLWNHWVFSITEGVITSKPL